MTRASEKLDSLVDEFVEQVAVDYVGLWEIAKVAREELGARSRQEIIDISLKIAKELYDNGLRPGDYDYGTHMNFWPDEGCRAMLERIEREWKELNGDPTHIDPICSFLRPKP